jgi:putative transposase
MRRPRMKAAPGSPVAYYHCVSRIVGREFLLGDEEKDQLVDLMRTYERLYGLRIVAYCIMSNHFHLLVEVPQRPAAVDLPSDAGLIAKVRDCLGARVADGLEWELSHLRAIGAGDKAEALRESWFARMWDISPFMKVLKQRFSQYYNGKHGRRGTLWEDRYRSVLVQGAGHALRAMAAYIDLNPVRAKICDDPKDYRWCGYAEAIEGGTEANEALDWLVNVDPHGGMRTGRSVSPDLAESQRRWRCFLFGLPEEESRGREEADKGRNAHVSRKRISRRKALEVLAEGGRLPVPDYLRCRVRYFTDGGAIGAREFVEEVFHESRDHFGPRRRQGAHPLRGLDSGGAITRLYNLRQLQRRVFE